MPDYIRLSAPTTTDTVPLEYIVRADAIVLITYDVARDTTTLTLRDHGTLTVANGPDDIETLLTSAPVAPPHQ